MSDPFWTLDLCSQCVEAWGLYSSGFLAWILMMIKGIYFWRNLSRVYF